jgi:hypothetical protein
MNIAKDCIIKPLAKFGDMTLLTEYITVKNLTLLLRKVAS